MSVCFVIQDLGIKYSGYVNILQYMVHDCTFNINFVTEQWQICRKPEEIVYAHYDYNTLL